MAKFNPNSRTSKALVASAILEAALEQETDPVKRERIQKVMGVVPAPLPKSATKCLLPSCNVYTMHNGGYCCAEHCRQREQELKEARKHV